MGRLGAAFYLKSISNKCNGQAGIHNSQTTHFSLSNSSFHVSRFIVSEPAKQTAVQLPQSIHFSSLKKPITVSVFPISITIINFILKPKDRSKVLKKANIISIYLENRFLLVQNFSIRKKKPKFAAFL